MKKYIICIFFGVLLIYAVTAQSLRGSTMFVSVQSVDVRSSTGLLAGRQGTLSFGNQVTILQENGRWVQIRSTEPALSGWVNVSALTSRRIVSPGTSASATELALAGKGFSETVERNYIADNSLDLGYVDIMETSRISAQELHDFLTEGRLNL